MNGQEAKSENRALVWELAIVTIALLVISRILYIFRGVEWIGESVSTIVAILLLYIPILMLWKMRRPIDFLDRNRKTFFKSVLVFLIATLIVFPPFLMIAHFWQVIVMGKHAFKAAPFPQFFNIAFYQLLLVSIPEEFYFRGYFQSTIDRVFRGHKRFLGVDLGAGWLITAAVFAIAHTIVAYQWWHFSIFFPALLFGYLRLKTGSITAPILFHATANVLMDWFARSYV